MSKAIRWGFVVTVAATAVALVVIAPGAGGHADDEYPHPTPTGPVVEVATGRSGDLTWSLATHPSEEGTCVELQLGGAERLAGGACGFGGDDVGIASTGGSGLGSTFVYGPVTDAAATVTVAFADGRTVSVPTIATPASGRFYLLAMDEPATALAATALDGHGLHVGESALSAGHP